MPECDFIKVVSYFKTPGRLLLNYAQISRSSVEGLESLFGHLHSQLL